VIWPLLGPLLTIGLALLVGRPGPTRPTVTDLELALRASAGETYGSEFGADLPAVPSPKKTSPAQLLLRMDLAEVPDRLLVATLVAGATGNLDPVVVADNVLGEIDGDLFRLTAQRQMAGLGPVAKARLLAASELYRRATVRATAQNILSIDGAESAWRLVRSLPVDPTVEYLVAIYLDRRLRVLGTRVLSRGSDAFTIVEPRMVLKPAVELGAYGIVMAHNHPSGDPVPSGLDIDVTRRMNKVCKILGVKLVDHMITTPTRYTSMAERGEM